MVKAKVIKNEDYLEKVFELKVMKKKPCWIGRSSGKKYKVNGISLSKDLEVSTTHGKFELQNDGNVYYVDTGSTNGSVFDGQKVKQDVPHMIKDKSILLVGATTFELTVS